MNDLIRFPSQKTQNIDSCGSNRPNKKYAVVLQSVITIEIETDASDTASAKTAAIEQFRNNGIMDGRFSQTKYKVISVEGVGDRAKCN